MSDIGDLNSRLDFVFDCAASALSILPQTPEENFNEVANRHRIWMEFKDAVREIFNEAIEVLPVAQSRSDLLEVAIQKMTEKLIEYPSTPYTFESTNSLANAMNALKISMEIDKANVPPKKDPFTNFKPCEVCGHRTSM